MQVGDLLARINDIDTSTLTIQEAHDIILESGIQIKLALTAYVFSHPFIYILPLLYISVSQLTNGKNRAHIFPTSFVVWTLSNEA